MSSPWTELEPAAELEDDPITRAIYRYAAMYLPPATAEEIEAFGRWMYRQGYRQCGRDTTAIGETIPVFRKYIEIAEQAD